MATSKYRLVSLSIIFLALVGCHTFRGDYPRSTSIVPAGALKIFPNYHIAFADIVQIAGVAVVVYTVVDPLAPNWVITETRVSETKVLFNLRMKDFHFGGMGEAPMVLARRAETLSAEQGMAGYQIQRYEEALDSRMIFPRRTAYAEIQLLTPEGRK